MRLRRGSHLIPALPRPGGEGGHAGEVGAREEGLRTATASTLQSPAGDSSPYEGELKGSKVAPCGAIKSAAKPQTFFGGGVRTPLSHFVTAPLREGSLFRLRAGRGI